MRLPQLSNTRFNRLSCIFCLVMFSVLAGGSLAQNQKITGAGVDPFNYPFVYDADSLKGFDEAGTWLSARSSDDAAWIQKRKVALQKRDFINRKYNLKNYVNENTAANKLIGGSNSIMQACTNVDFELGNISGWTITEGPNNGSNTMAGCCPNVSSMFAIVGPGTDPNTGIPTVPPGAGNFTCRFGDMTIGGMSYRLKQTFTVTPASTNFVFRYAVILEDGAHICNEQPFFNVTMVDCNNNPIPCSSFFVVAGNGCTGFSNFQNNGLYLYKNWQTRAFDLTPFVGSCVTIEFTVGGCVSWQGAHAGYAYVDCSCQPMNLTLNNVVIPTGSTSASVCNPGTNVLCAPLGFNYTWVGPGVNGSNNNNQCINVNSAGNYSVTLSTPGQNCFNPVLTCNFVVSPPPVANFNYTSTPCASSVNVVSTSQTNGGTAITNYVWNWNDGTPTSTLNPDAHAYTTAGTQQIKLVVTNSSGCKDSITKTINVTVPPIINFTVNPACLGFNSNFTNVSTTGGASSITYTWNFGSGGTSNAVNPSMNFTTPGTYTASLTGLNSDNCSNTVVNSYTVYPRPTISFSALPVCVGAATSFTNTSSIPAPGSIAGWAWDFNNDAVTDNTTQSPTNVFASAGTFPVELKATSNMGCADSALVNIVVNPGPTVDFTAVAACKKYNIVLNNTSSATAPASMSSYTWSFGSGNGSSMQTSNAINPANLSYSIAGVQTITLSGTSSDGCLGTATHTVDVYASPTASFTPASVCSGAATTFTDNSTPVAPANGAVTGWAWDFDNNGTTDNTTQNPSNAYPTSGTYTTALIVTSANGCRDTIRKTVNVWGRAVPNFTPSGVCFNTATTFTNQTSVSVNANTGSASSYTWSFGDGGSSTQTTPVHTYTNPANATANTNYSATLFVTTSNGCKDSVTKVVTVYSLPTPDFTADSVCFGNATTLQDISNPNGNPFLFFRWDWDNDGIPDVTNNSLSTQNTFTAWGSIPLNYTVITSPNGGLLNCWSAVSKNIWVHPSPVASFVTANKCIDAQPVQVNAAASSVPVGTISNYGWAFGDGSSSTTNTGAANTHSYTSPGIYVITLTVSSANGCSNTTTNTVEVYDKPYGSFVYSKTCFNQTTTLTAVPSASGGVVASYGWDFNNTPQSVEAMGAQVTTTFAAAGQQTLNLLLTSDKGCNNVVPGNVYINYNPQAHFYAPKRMGCTDLCITIKDSASSVPGPAQIISWDWNFGNGFTWNAGSAASNYVCYTNSSNYNLKKYDVRLIVRTDSGCVDTMTRKNYIVVYPKPVADFIWAGEDGDILTPVITFTNTSQGYTNFQWYWNDALNALDSVHTNPKHYYTTDEPKTVNVYLAIRNSYGCKDTVMKPIEIGGNFTFYIPNCFTPNGDGLNDTFQGTGIGIKDYKMWIFDRWGEMIYYTNDIKKGWDGSVKKHATDGKQDVYQWKVIVTDLNSKAHYYVGHVTQLPD